MKKLNGLVVVVASALIITGCQSTASGQTPLLDKYGVGTVLHPLKAAPRAGAPYQCLSNVHVFGVNGGDPLGIANFNGLCSHLKDQGCDAHFAQLYSITDMVGKIRTIRATDPNARVVLMGYSSGCNRVRALARELGEKGIQIDLLVYLAGDTIFNTPRSSPPNVARIVNVRANGFLLTGGNLVAGADLPNARNVRLNTRHLLVPSRPEVADLVTDELLALSGGPGTPVAPAGTVASSPVPPVMTGPTPQVSGPVMK